MLRRGRPPGERVRRVAWEGWLPSRATQSRPRRVLVVCDSDGCRELLSRLLAADGYAVERARSAAAAAAALATTPPDGVVLALVVGGVGSSLQLLATIRSHPDPAVAATRVVLVADAPQNSLSAWRAGADAFLVRPFHADDLHVSAHSALTRADDERSVHRQHQIEQAEGQLDKPEPKFSK